LEKYSNHVGGLSSSTQAALQHSDKNGYGNGYSNGIEITYRLNEIVWAHPGPTFAFVSTSALLYFIFLINLNARLRQ